MDSKRYIIRKYVMAKDCKDAIKKEKKQGVDEVFVDDVWMEENTKRIEGFK